VGDIDAEPKKVHIHQAKGKKDRYVTLPASTLHTLRQYCKTRRHPQ